MVRLAAALALPRVTETSVYVTRAGACECLTCIRSLGVGVHIRLRVRLEGARSWSGAGWHGLSTELGGFVGVGCENTGFMLCKY